MSTALGALISGFMGFGQRAVDASYNEYEALNARNFAREQLESEQNFNSQQAQINRDFQKQEAQLAREWQEGFYNQYESPAAMMRQYQSAGLNPALMYQGAGSGSVPGTSVPSGSAASSSSGNSVSAPYTQLSNPLEFIQAALSLSKIKSEIDNMNADSDLKRANAEGQKISNEYSPELLKQNLRRGEVDIDNLKAGTQVALSSLDKIASETEKLKAEKGLIALQGVLADSQSKSLDSKTLEQNWRNQYIKNTGSTPSDSNWGQVVKIAYGIITRINDRFDFNFLGFK